MPDSCLSEEKQIVIQSFSSMIFTEIGCAKKKFKIPVSISINTGKWLQIWKFYVKTHIDVQTVCLKNKT